MQTRWRAAARGTSLPAAMLAAIATTLLAAGCASTPAVNPALAPTRAAAIDLNAVHEQYRAAGLDERQVEPAAYRELVAAVLDADPQRFRVAEIGSSVEGRPLYRIDFGSIGSSVEGRPLYRIDFGSGPTTVLLWSQMHGDESTATRSLVDIFGYLLANTDDAAVQRIESELSVTFVPMLNPDGAARFVRHNAVGIDINRDARLLATPEGRALKAVRDSIDAEWGFNLHDQNIRTRRGRTDEGVLISLLAPPPGAGITSPANQNAKHLIALIVHALRPVVGDAMARYSETFNPRAFGDLMAQWGTATILIESGGELDDPNKELPRRANFVAILAALDAIANDTWQQFSQDAYADLPPNGRAVNDLLIVGATIALPGREPVRADVTVRFDDPLARTGGVVGEVGDLEGVEALETLDASGLYLVPRIAPDDAAYGPALLPGVTLDGVISRDRAGTQVVWRLEAGRPIAVGQR